MSDKRWQDIAQAKAFPSMAHIQENVLVEVPIANYQ